MLLDQQIQVVLKALNCGVCHTPFAMAQSKYDKCLSDGERFFCPNGHSLVFTESEKQKVEKRLKHSEDNAQWYKEAYERQIKNVQREKNLKRGVKIQLSKLKNRVKNGVCPCCNRHFENLHNHIKTKHPDYTTTNKPI